MTCPDCGTKTVPPMMSHFCTGRPADKALEQAQTAQLAGTVRMLQRAGLKVTKED